MTTALLSQSAEQVARDAAAYVGLTYQQHRGDTYWEVIHTDEPGERCYSRIVAESDTHNAPRALSEHCRVYTTRETGNRRSVASTAGLTFGAVILEIYGAQLGEPLPTELYPCV